MLCNMPQVNAVSLLSLVYFAIHLAMAATVKLLRQSLCGQSPGGLHGTGNTGGQH